MKVDLAARVKMNQEDHMQKIKIQIMEALEHPEAQDGLYFRNFFYLHEEDERKAVEGDEIDILDALRELISDGKVVMDESGEEAIFQLSDNHASPHIE